MTDCERTKDLYTIRDVTHDHIVTVHGRGQVHLIGTGSLARLYQSFSAWLFVYIQHKSSDPM